MPLLSTYSASKAAAWSFTNAARVELKRQGTHVVGILDGLKFLEADLTVPVSGGVGAWAKSDTVVLFDSFSVDPTAQ